MKSRLAMVITALILAALATIGAMIYIQSINARIKEGATPLNVLIAKQPVREGTSLQDLKDQDLTEIERIPKRYVVEGAYSDLSQIDGEILTTSLSVGEQLTSSKFRKKSQAGLSYQIPEAMLAISIPVDEVIGVSDQIKQGDRVDVIATFSPGPGGADMSKTLLQNVEVLSASANNADSKSAGRVG